MLYEAVGHIRISGCAIKLLRKNYYINFPVGSRVFIKRKAKEGVLESVVLKKVQRIVRGNSYSGVEPVISYIDTFNRVWIEEELTWEENAIDYAKLYWLDIKEKASELIESGCPTENLEIITTFTPSN
jgi:hypothetical protein